MTGVKCQVHCCRYVAEAAIGNSRAPFRVCLLHDAPQVRALVKAGRMPAAYWHSMGKPVVLSCGELVTEIVEGDFGRCCDDPSLAEVVEAPSVMVGAFCDLTQGEWVG